MKFELKVKQNPGLKLLHKEVIDTEKVNLGHLTEDEAIDYLFELVTDQWSDYKNIQVQIGVLE